MATPPKAKTTPEAPEKAASKSAKATTSAKTAPSKTTKSAKATTSAKAASAKDTTAKDGATKPARAPKTKKPVKDQTPQADAGAADDEKIARRAYELYEQRGRKHGHHEDDWHQAKREIHGVTKDR